MKIGNPKLILDLYDWLPSDGESKVVFRSVGSDVVLDVLYENESLDSDIEDETIHYSKREIVFKSVKIFIKTPTPGFSLFEYDSISESNKPEPGSLIEYLSTDFAKNSMKSYRAMFDRDSCERHFSVQFLSANVGFHILAENVLLSGELPFN